MITESNPELQKCLRAVEANLEVGLYRAASSACDKLKSECIRMGKEEAEGKKIDATKEEEATPE